MRTVAIASLGLLGIFFGDVQSAPAAEHKPEDDAAGAKAPVHEGEPEIAIVQPVAILMDNGDVVPLPVGGPEFGEDDPAVHELEAAGVGYADAYGAYGPGIYGAYPGPQGYGYGGYDMEPAVDSGTGRHLTQKVYATAGPRVYQPMAYAAGPLRPPLINRPIVNKPIINRPIVNKPIINKPIINRPFDRAYYSYPTVQPIAPIQPVEIAETPIIEQPIYRPPPVMPRPPIMPTAQPLYDSRYYAGQRPYYPQLPEQTNCPRGMKCTAKSYYVPAAPVRPVYGKQAIAARPGKYFKRAAYSASKYQY